MAPSAPLHIGTMKPDKHLVGALGIILTAIGLIALTWIGTIRAIHVQRLENVARVDATLTNQALTMAEQINRQFLALDQTLRMVVSAWESNPTTFDLEALRRQAVVLNGISRDMILTDAAGIVRQSSVVPAINLDVSATDFFRDLADPHGSPDRMFIGPASISAIMRQWHMDVARALHHPDGSFAGVIAADYRISAMTDIFRQTDLGAGGFVTLVGLEDGKMRGTVGPASVDPDVSITDTRMFAAIQRSSSGPWTGPTATDPAVRIHTYRRIPDRPLVLVVAMNEQEAMHPATVWRQQAEVFAGCITVLPIGLAGVLLHAIRLGQRRERAMAEDRAVLAAANAQLEVARALIAAKAERLEATLAGMTDGVSMFDEHLCLVEWNARFPEIAGVPKEMLRVGLAMEEMLRAQIASGQFGHVVDPEGEIERRVAQLRTGPIGAVQRQTSDGRTLELRRNRLPNGGFVTLYADVTAHKQAEATLRQVRTEAEAANAARSRFVAFVSHEIRTPLDTLLNTLRLLGDDVPPQQQSLLAMARRSGDMLSGLVSDILEMSQMEAGKLAIRPDLFDLRRLLDNRVGLFALQAADRGVTLRIAIADATPPTLLADEGRLRQVLLNLIANALKYARPGDVWLTAEPGPTEARAITLAVRDSGPVIEPAVRDALFRPFSRLDRPDGDALTGTGLGLAICRHLIALMGGDVGCEPWIDASGQAGNNFWAALPATALPFREATDPALQAEILQAIRAAEAQRDAEAGSHPTMLAEGAPDRIGRLTDPLWRPVPRTHVLLADDIPVNQLVTATLLRREGHCVDVVASGTEAVEAVRNTPYDLVLMDVFMPGMNGPEVVRMIRSLPEPACSIPILALTAGASEGDAEVLKAASMNSILGKPVSLVELVAALRTYVWSPRPPGDTAPILAETPATADNRDPWAVLSHDRISEIRTNLPPETFATLINECLTDLDHRLPALRRAVATANPAAITAHAHAMVGIAAGYGMIALESRLRIILVAARDGDMTMLTPDVVTEVASDLTEAARLLRNIVSMEAA